MKKILLVCTFLIGISVGSFAQGGQRRGGGTPEQRLTTLKTAIAPLTLTDDQVAKLTVVYTASSKSMDSLRTATGDDRSVLREKMMPVMTATNTKVNAILTPEQAAAYKKYTDEMRAKMQQGGN